MPKRNLLKVVKNFLFPAGRNSNVPVQKNSIFYWMGYQREVWPTFAITSSVRTYLDNDAIFTIINKDAKKFASITRYIRDAEGNKSPTGKNYNGLKRLLQRPNAHQGQSLFFDSVRVSRVLQGEAIIWLNRGIGIWADAEMSVWKPDAEIDKMPVLEMIPMPPQLCNPVSDGTPFGIKEWVFKNGAKNIRLRKGDVIHWKSSNPNFDIATMEHLRGVSPLQPGRKTQTEYDEIQAGNVRMIKNDGSKKALVNEDDARPTDTQMQELREIVNENFNSNETKGKVSTLGGKWSVLNLGSSSIDMDLLAAKKLTMQNLAFMFDLPFEFWDSQTTFANKEQALLYWVTNCIMPACKQLDDEMNRLLCKAFGLETAEGDYSAYICSDVSELPEMRKALQSQADYYAKMWQIPPNLVLEAMGYQKINNALFDEPFIPAGYTPLSDLGDSSFNQKMQDIKNRI